MDILSVAGFALNVVSYLKENPIDFDNKIDEPVAVAEDAPRSKALADIKMPLAPSRIARQQAVARPQQELYLPKNDTSYRKRTSVGNGGQISMARINSSSSSIEETSAAPQQKEAPKINSGLDQSGRYFFRKRDL